MFYVIHHHGTAGPHDSYGYAETIEADDEPPGDMTMTVAGPFARQALADQFADDANVHAARARRRLDGIEAGR